MISAFSEFERSIIRQRVKAGMEKAKAKGKMIGRPQVSQFTINEVREMKEKGSSYKEICKKLGISKSAYYGIIRKPT
jgi:DNA invertase Pin-like site-specific DNA recombinase